MKEGIMNEKMSVSEYLITKYDLHEYSDVDSSLIDWEDPSTTIRAIEADFFYYFDIQNNFTEEVIITYSIFSLEELFPPVESIEPDMTLGELSEALFGNIDLDRLEDYIEDAWNDEELDNDNRGNEKYEFSTILDDEIMESIDDGPLKWGIEVKSILIEYIIDQIFDNNERYLQQLPFSADDGIFNSNNYFDEIMWREEVNNYIDSVSRDGIEALVKIIDEARDYFDEVILKADKELYYNIVYNIVELAFNNDIIGNI